MAQWVSHSRGSTLDELIRMEGRGSYIQSICAECSKPQPTLRCEDCFGRELFCQDCVVKLHIRNPLHHIKVFDFLLPFYHRYLTESIALEWDLLRRHNSEVFGLRIQLGHRPGDCCISPKPASGDDFVIIDSHGIHEVGLDYCGCEGATASETQLLRFSLYPVTSMNPKSAANVSCDETISPAFI
jgi:hypothetical protein